MIWTFERTEDGVMAPWDVAFEPERILDGYSGGRCRGGRDAMVGEYEGGKKDTHCVLNQLLSYMHCLKCSCHFAILIF